MINRAGVIFHQRNADCENHSDPFFPQMNRRKFFKVIACLAAASPIVGHAQVSAFGRSAEAVDKSLQKSELWQVLRREFPDWYSARLKEVADLSTQDKTSSEIHLHLIRALVNLRRLHAQIALAASPARHKAIAEAFVENLIQLRKHSVEACYGLISQSEAHPLIASLLQGSPYAPRLERQMIAVFQAVADGRRSPRAYDDPTREDFEVLLVDLKIRGWTQADFQTFSDAGALGRASPEKTCQLIHDWFSAHLAVADPVAQQRLLADSIRPIVGG